MLTSEKMPSAPIAGVSSAPRPGGARSGGAQPSAASQPQARRAGRGPAGERSGAGDGRRGGAEGRGRGAAKRGLGAEGRGRGAAKRGLGVERRGRGAAGLSPGKEEPPVEASILIADAQLLFADALARGLRAVRGFTVMDAHPTQGLEATGAVSIFKPDILLIDYWMPGLLAPGVIRAISYAAPDCRAIVLSWLYGEREIQNSLMAGAAGFIPKSVAVDEVVEAIRQAHAGQVPVRSAELNLLLDRLRERGDAGAQLWQRFRKMSPRELKVLALMGAGLYVKDISKQLGVTEKTVRNYVNAILQKAEAHSQMEAVAMARDAGVISG